MKSSKERKAEFEAKKAEIRAQRAEDKRRFEQTRADEKQALSAKREQIGEDRRAKAERWGVSVRVFGGNRGRVTIPAVPHRQQQVAGVSHHQDGFRGTAPGPSLFELKPEPRNKHDGNAVKVMLNRRLIGYLSSKMAPDYQPLVAQLRDEGDVFTEGEVEQWSGGLGALLHLPRADRLALWAAVPPEQRDKVALRAERFRLKSVKDYAAGIEALVGARRVTPVEVTAQPYTVERGKYKGQLGLSFWVGATPVGLLGPNARTEADTVFQWVEHEQPFTLPAEITSTGSGYRVEVEYYLPLGGWTPPVLRPSPPPPPPPPPPTVG